MQVTRARAAVQPVIEVISVFTGCLLMLYAYWTDLAWTELIVFLIALLAMYDPVKKLSRLHLAVQQCSAAADRIFEILDTPLTVRERPGARVFEGDVRRVTFEHVSFHYDEDWVLLDIDLSVAAGTPVRASADGRFSFAGRAGDFGRLVVIDHGGGYETRYAHLKSIEVKQGRRVERGHIVGRVGKSGNATGHHLHYEVRLQGTPVDPRSYL